MQPTISELLAGLRARCEAWANDPQYLDPDWARGMLLKLDGLEAEAKRQEKFSKDYH